MITIREKDIELYISVSNGFKGFFDDKDKRVLDSKISQEQYDKAIIVLEEIGNPKTIEELKKNIRPNIPYALDIMDNELIFTWGVTDDYYGKCTWGINIVYGQIE